FDGNSLRSLQVYRFHDALMIAIFGKVRLFYGGLLTPFAGREFDFPPLELIGVMVEIDVLTIGFELASLKVDVVGTHTGFGWIKRLVVVAVGRHAELIKAAKIKIAQFPAFTGI